jgi:hypothetical protein
VIPEGLLSELGKRGVALAVQGDNLKYRAPQGVLTPDLLGAIADHKREILTRLRHPGWTEMDYVFVDASHRIARDYPLGLHEWLEANSPGYLKRAKALEEEINSYRDEGVTRERLERYKRLVSLWERVWRSAIQAYAKGAQHAS